MKLPNEDLQQPILTFKENALVNAKKIQQAFDNGRDKVLAVGETQIGKQLMALMQTRLAYEAFASTLSERQQGAFINIDIVCDSDNDVRKQKIDRHRKYWNSYTFQPGVKFINFVGQHDDLLKFMKDSNENQRCLQSYGGDFDDRKFSKNELESVLKTMKVPVRCNLQLDEFHQYKRLEGAVHRFLRDFAQRFNI